MTALPLTTSYWPADTSTPLLETTIGGVLRAAAERAPGQPALISGHPDPARRRQWRYGELLAGAERGARALLAVRARRPGRGVGGQLPRMGAARVRRRAGRGDARDGQPGVPGGRARARAR